MKKQNQKTVEDLQNYLWDVLEKLKNKKIKVTEANAMTMAAKEICNSARLELQYKAFMNQKIEAGDIPLLERK